MSLSHTDGVGVLEARRHLDRWLTIIDTVEANL